MIRSCIPSIQLKDYNIPIVGVERESIEYSGRWVEKQTINRK